MTIAEEKAELRRRMRAMRASIPEFERTARSEAATGRLITLPEVAASHMAFVFNAFGSEIATAPLIDRLARAGLGLALPRLTDGVLEAIPYRPGDPVAPSPYGALEPLAGGAADPRDVDLIIAPGLAFDSDGYRLGYGGGYYDAFLRRAGRHAARIGFAFDQQIVDAVPHDDKDERLDGVVSDARVVRAAGS